MPVARIAFELATQARPDWVMPRHTRQIHQHTTSFAVPPTEEEWLGTTNADTEVVSETIQMAKGAIGRAQRSLSHGHHLQGKLKDLKAERLASSLREAMEEESKDSQLLDGVFRKISEHRELLSKQQLRGEDSADTLRALALEAEQAKEIVERMDLSLHNGYRRAWTLVDIYKNSAAALTYEESKDTSKVAEFVSEEDSAAEQAPEPPKTSAGCQCDEKSPCAEHGREFKWCRVQSQPKDATTKEDIKCPLQWDPARRDAAGNDHRLNGGEQPLPMWDYCRLPKPTGAHEPAQDPTLPAFAHRGCKCGFRGDLLGKYSSNDEYKDKAGRFDWSRVPWNDRLGLEAMVIYFQRRRLAMQSGGGVGTPPNDQDQICLRTPSSGAHHICPAELANEDNNPDPIPLGDPGWCGDHSWDFCVPSEPPEAPEGTVAASDLELGVSYRLNPTACEKFAVEWGVVEKAKCSEVLFEFKKEGEDDLEFTVKHAGTALNLLKGNSHTFSKDVRSDLVKVSSVHPSLLLTTAAARRRTMTNALRRRSRHRKAVAFL